MTRESQESLQFIPMGEHKCGKHISWNIPVFVVRMCESGAPADTENTNVMVVLEEKSDHQSH